MANEIVKYENRLNAIPFRKFNSRELNLFFSIASRIREQGTDEITLSFESLKELSQYKQHGERLITDLNKTYHKLLLLNAMTDDGVTVEAFVLFTDYKINRESQTVTIAVNNKFKSLFNNLEHWTRFSLRQFSGLRSTYSKTMFRLLKQYRITGTRSFTMEEFRSLLDVPKSYQTDAIDRRILHPIKEELSPLFKGLGVRKLHKGRGGKISGYCFSWKPERKGENDFSRGAWDERIALDNIKYNSELTEDEKARATDKVKGLPLGTTAKQHQINTEAKKKEGVEKRSRQELLNGLHNITGH